jgi:hypothetical protein
LDLFGGNLNEQNFEEWLEKTQANRDELFAYSKTEMPTDAGERTKDIDRSLRSAEAAGLMLSDCQFFLTMNTAQMYTAADLAGQGNNAKEREILVKDAVKDVQRLYDYLEILTRTLNTRVRAGMNARRSIL